MHVRSCCFANLNLLLFCRSRCRRRRRCLSSLKAKKKIQRLIGILPKKTIAPWERYLVLSKALSLGIEKQNYCYVFIYLFNYYYLFKFVMLLLCAFSCKVFDCTRQPLRVFFWHDFIVVRSKQQQINGVRFCQHAYFLLRYFELDSHITP